MDDEKEITIKGKKMVLIPGGKFRMGSDSGYPEEKPAHDAEVSSFYMDESPVTNAEFRAFCDDTGRHYPSNPRWEDMPDYFLSYPEHPVVGINYNQAKAYADWAGKRLPSEEEWEYAAAGGLNAPTYAWGEERPDGKNANYCDASSDLPWHDPSANDGWKYTSPVGAFPPNGYGLYDMTGNVWEWTEDWFFLYSDKIRSTKDFTDGWGGRKVCRGGCYQSNARDLRITRRRASEPNFFIGFRCVRDLEGTEHVKKDSFEMPSYSSDWKSKIGDIGLKLPDGLELCMGVSPDADTKLLDQLHALGFTSAEQYVTWETCENDGKDQWNFANWDKQLANIRAAGLKWLPFIIAGPAYSLPDWYRRSTEHHGLVCLEHNIETKINSIWDKNFRRYIERFLKKLSEHYSDHSVFEGLLFGITGDFGEAIMPDAGNWTSFIPGFYHSHSGYWCNDRFARADFIEKMRRKFGTIEKLNASWETDFKVFEAVRFPELESGPDNFRADEHTDAGKFVYKNAADVRRWVDFIDWYRASMADYASFWMKTARKYFPETELYLCTGGRAQPWQASEFAIQAKLAAAVGGGLRITNENSKYPLNFIITNWVASACDFYNTYFSNEPAGQVTDRGVVCRIFNAAAEGARSLHFYTGNILGNEQSCDNFCKYFDILQNGRMQRDIAVFYPDTPSILDFGKTASRIFTSFGVLRDYTDYVYACDLTVRDGILDRVKVLFLTVGGYYRHETLARIRKFVENGGILIGLGIDALYDIKTGKDRMASLFGKNGKVLGSGRTLLLSGADGKDCFAEGSVSKNGDNSTYLAEMQQILDQVTAFLAENGIHIADGVLDQLYTAQKNDALLIFNYSGKDIRRSFTRPDGSSFELESPDCSILNISI